jgi:hypothetical protein
MATALAGMPGTPADRATPRDSAEIAVVGLVAALAIVWFGQWLDNGHYSTTNGLWKSTLVAEWKADFSTGRIDASNYLYFPLTAALGRLLDLAGLHAGVAWRQLVVIDGLFGGLAVSFVYWIARRLTGRREIALFAGLFHLGGAFFLSLAVSDEDILPSYTLVLGSMATAAVWFSAPSARQVACVATLFTLGWLIEWRLMFPTLPPLLLALALSRGTLRRRAGLILLFLGVMVGIALLTAACFEGHIGAVGLDGILWTGKGVDTGWAGFSMEKLALVAVGMGEYWLGGRNLSAAHLFTPIGAEWGGAFALELVLLGLGLLLFWRRRHDPVARTVAIVFIGTLGAGEFMNAYSQPNDPQMQINVMPWLTVVAALLVADFSVGRGRTVGLSVVVAAVLLACLPLAYNMRQFSELRGRDGRAMAELQALEKISDPAATVYVFAGFEGITTWLFVNWDPHWEGVCDVGPSPQPGRRFKWAALFGFLVHHPSWTQEEYLAAVKTEIDCAFDKGYRVIASPVWNSTEQALADQMTPLGKKAFAPALLALLHAYPGTPVGDSGYGYYELRRP